ncbi:MAG TPA: hypothetical protein VFA90_08205 [Terriglobales bacterium]|nr:hypothetical protein [Terriglobales bacterium]
MRAFICCLLIAIMPSAVLAGTPQNSDSQSATSSQTPSAQSGTIPRAATPAQPAGEQAPVASPAGVLYGNGSVFLDGAQLSNSMPVMTGDVVETKEVSAAHVEMSGSSAMLQSNAIVRFRNEGVALDRGVISIGTGKSLSVFTRDYQITPVSPNWTQFEVERSGGLIQISAIKNDVELKCGAEKPTVVKEGHHLTRPDAKNCGLADADDSNAPPAETGPGLASPAAKGVGLAIAGGLLGWTLSHIGDDAVSPDSPDKP